MKGTIKKVLSLVLSLAMVVTVCPQMQLVNISAAEDDEPYCISVGRPVYASSQSGGDAPENGVDGNDSSRWQAAQDDENEWFYVDLGKTADIDHIYIHWEAAYAKSYKIEFSNDEENWTEVYSKGNTSTETEGDGSGETVAPDAIKIKAGAVKTNDNGTKSSILSWDAVDGAVTYKIFVDDENTVATAPDGFTFDKDNRLDLINDVKLLEGTHEYIVVAYGSDGELTRGSITLSDEITETTTEEPSEEESTNSTEDPLKQTISFDNLTTEQKQARYVRITMTERALAYGCSFYEFQAYGDNGFVKRPANYGTNLALNKPVVSRKNTIIKNDKEVEVDVRDEWWMYDSDGNLLEDAYNNVKPENAVDGDAGTSYTSYQGDDQWIYVDLQQEYTIGRIIINWNADAGKIYDVEVSSDATNWKTVHRVTKGYAYNEDNFTLYQENVRYVRVFGYTKVESGSGFGIYELSVYEYKEGDSKENETLEDLPQEQIYENPNGKGSYVSGQMYNEKNKLPTFVNEENIKVPVDSNSWWSSAMVQKFSNLLCVTPLKAGFSTKGLGVLTATSGWVGERGPTDLGTDQSTETGRDFYISTDNLDSASTYDRVENYGDYSVELGLMDDNGLQMKTTLVKGSPYFFNDFCDNKVVFISGVSITEFYDKDGNVILGNKGDVVTTDHIAFKSMDEENTKAKNEGSYYCVNVPEGTTFKTMVAGSNCKIKITFPENSDNYMSVAAMTDAKAETIQEYYEHGYAFVTDTYVGYTFDQGTSKIVTKYTLTTNIKRQGFSDVSMQALLPHQWKRSSDADNPVTTYTSIRGDMKAIWSNEFTTTQQFAGLLPTFATPNSDMFDSQEMVDYLNTVVASKVNTAPVSDAYWEGKNVHPLAISAVMADQLGENEIRDKLLKKLKSILEDWFTYSGGDDRCYLIYNKDWGTVYYPDSAYGANAAICDHHFTYGYFMYGAAVLASYDREFYNEYKDMVEILVRDYANPSDDEMFCKFRAFDQYAGHSWAGGYGDSDSGNNQESASEALFSWVGMYLWGEATGNQSYIDAGAYGFTTEMDAVEQYWFDYDETNWLEDYPFEGTGQIYGASMGYGTYFGGQPVYVYGIQWLPISEYLTNYGMNQEKCAKIYQGLEDDTNYAIGIETILHEQELADGLPESEWWHDPDKYVTPDNGWQHITWPFLSQTNPQSAYDKFEANVTSVQAEDRANTLWFISAMDQLGYRTNDYVVTGNIQGSVYVKDTKDDNGNVASKTYTAQVWNPTDKAQTVTIKKQNGDSAGTATIASGALVSFNINNISFDLTQVSTPIINVTPLAGGDTVEGVNGNVSYEDTQLVELVCDEGATIYYTTDGTIPTTDSNKYEAGEKILVSSDTTIKAFAVKDGCIDSAYNATTIIIEGTEVSSDENLALNKPATASSQTDGDTAGKVTDGDNGTRWQAKTIDDIESNDQWIYVDLGFVQSINKVVLNWEAAYASKYQIQVSVDGENWTTVSEESGMAGEMISEFAAVNARYVKMQGVQRGTQYEYSIYEFEVYGAQKADAPAITPESGTYKDAQTVTMSTDVKGAEIKYTLDGSDPTEDSKTYTEPVTVSKSTIVKAVTYRKGMSLSDVTSSEIIIEGTISLDITSAKVAIGRTLQIQAVTDKNVSWTSSDNSIATVENGLVTAKTVGTVTITATIPNGEKAECTIEVIAAIPITEIEISNTTLTMKNLTTDKLSVRITPEDTTDDTTVTWESSDDQVVSVDKNGKLTAKSEGQATIIATVGTHTSQCLVTVEPAATVEEMIAGQKYNLALGKDVIPSGVMPDGEGTTKDKITDGSLSTAHCAVTAKDGAWAEKEPSYVIVDLGAYYKADTIEQVVIAYKNSEANASVVEHSYSVAFSKDGYEYETVVDNKSIATAEELDDSELHATIDNVSATGYVRYVKVSYPSGAQFGMQLKEIAVLDRDCNTETIEIPEIENPAGFTVSSNNLSEITYTIFFAVGHEDFKYNVYMDGIKIADNIDAGSYTITDVAAGIHTLRVVSVSGESVSSGIEKEVEVDDGTYTRLLNNDRNIALGATVTVDTIESEHQEGSTDTSILVDGEVSATSAKTVHTTWGGLDKEATITLELVKEYDASDIEAVLMAFKAENTSATAYNVEFSSDGTNYETVAEVTEKAYADTYEDKVDTSSYTQGTVKYVRFNITDGNCNWGYQISEVAVFGVKNITPIVEESVVSNDLGVTGFQMTTTLGGIADTVAIRTIYQKEPTVEGQSVKKFGLVFGLDNGEITDEDMVINSSSIYVTDAAATDEGKRDSQMGESATAEYYAMTMPTGNGYNQDYKVRVYAKLADGRIAYSAITSYNVFNIAKDLYDNKKMPTGTAHDSLYKVLTSVDSSYEKVDYIWNNTLVNKPESTENEVNIEGYQMSASLNGVDGAMGLRVVYSVDGTAKDASEVGLVYGLVYNNNGITATDMTLENSADISNQYVVSYAATVKGLLDVQMGSSTTANYYARTMNVSNLNKNGYTVTYLVRAYAKNSDGTVTYSDVYEYTINDVASQLYDNTLMSTYSGHKALYDNILTKVNPLYSDVEYNWNNTVVGK